MSKFSDRLKKFNISDRTAWVELPELGDKSRVEVRPSGQTNTDYYNDLLRMSGNEPRKKKNAAEKLLTMDEVRKDRRQQARLFAKHVIVGWSDVCDDEGNKVEFSYDNVVELLDALLKEAPEIFDRIRDVADDTSEFYDTPDAEELAENSHCDSSGS